MADNRPSDSLIALRQKALQLREEHAGLMRRLREVGREMEECFNEWYEAAQS